MATLIEDELSAKVAVNEGGQRRTLSKRAAIVKQFVNKAVQGDIRTFQTLVKVQESALIVSVPVESNDEGETPGPDDRAILKAYESKLKRRFEQSKMSAKNPTKATRKRRKK